MQELKTPLNEAQLMLLQMFSRDMSKNEMDDLRSCLSKFYLEKLRTEADKKNYSQNDFMNWVNEPDK